MNIDGRKIFDKLVKNMWERIQKENWRSYSFTHHEVYYKENEKDVSFYFQKDNVVFAIEMYANKEGEKWIERTLIEYEVYRKTEDEDGIKVVPYHEFGEIKEHLEKLYDMLKDEIGKIIESHPCFRMEYLFNRDKMIRPATGMNIVLRKIKKERDEGTL